MKFKHIKIIALTVLLGGVSQCFAMQSNALSRVMKIKKTDIDGVIEAFSDIKTLTVEELAHCWNILKNSEKAELATDILNAHPEEKKKLDEYMMQVLPIPVITPEVVKEEASQVYNVVPSGESGKRHKKDRRLYYELPRAFGLKVVNEEPENKTCGSWGNPPMVRSGSDYDNYDEELSDLSLPNSLAKQMTQEVVDKMPVINDPDDAFNCLFDLDALVLNPLAGKIIAKCLDLLKTTEVYGIAVEMVANHSIAQAKLDEYRVSYQGYLKWRVTEVVSMLAEKIMLVDFYNALMHIKKADPEMYKLIIAPLAASATGVRDCREVICDRLRQVGMVNGCLATPEYAVLKGVLERDSEACQLAISLLGQSGVLSIDLQIALMELQDSGTQQVQEPFGKKRPSNHNYDD